MKKQNILFFFLIVFVFTACDQDPLAGIMGEFSPSSTPIATALPISTSTPQPTSTPTPLPTSAPTPTPTFSPTPTITPPSVEELMVTAFSNLSSVVSCHFVIEIETMLDADENLALTFTGDFLQPDSSRGSMSIRMGGFTIESDFIGVGDQFFTTNPETGEWESNPDKFINYFGFSKDEICQPIVNDPKDFKSLNYLGIEDMNERSLYHIRGVLSGDLLSDQTLAVDGDVQTDYLIGIDDNQIYSEEISFELIDRESAERMAAYLRTEYLDNDELAVIEIPDIPIQYKPNLAGLLGITYEAPSDWGIQDMGGESCETGECPRIRLYKTHPGGATTGIILMAVHPGSLAEFEEELSGSDYEDTVIAGLPARWRERDKNVDGLLYLEQGKVLKISGQWMHNPDDESTVWEIINSLQVADNVIETEPVTVLTPEPGAIRIASDGSGDYPDLETAINSVNSGTTIFIAPGRYQLEESLHIEKAITLIGSGTDVTEIVSTAPGSVLYFNGSGPFVLEGIAISHEGDQGASVVIVDGGEIEISACSFTGAVFRDGEWITVDPNDLEAVIDWVGGPVRTTTEGIPYLQLIEGRAASGLELNGNVTGTVKDSIAFGNAGNGFQVGDDADVSMIGNRCENNVRLGIAFVGRSTGIAQSNSCSGNLGGIGVFDQSQPQLEENSVQENEEAGIFYTDSSGGVARSNECSGNYFGIWLLGEAQPSLEENYCHDNSHAGIEYIGSAAGTALGNICSGNEHGIIITFDASPIIEKNQLTENQNSGIFYWDKAAGVSRNNECSYNESAGIIVDDQAEPTLEANTCTENGEVGIGISGEAQPVILDNVVTGNVSGVAYTNSAKGLARGNTVSDNAWFGFEVGAEAEPTLEDNACSGNGMAGIGFFDDSGGVARGNTCSDNEGTGIFVNNQAQPVLEANILTGNATDGIGYAGKAAGTAVENSCSGNKVGIRVTENAKPTLELNILSGNITDGIFYTGDAGGVARQNSCFENEIFGIEVSASAAPTLEANSCFGNLVAGIVYDDQAGGIARENQCYENQIGIAVGEEANPELVDNNCHDNSEHDILDVRP